MLGVVISKIQEILGVVFPELLGGNFSFLNERMKFFVWFEGFFDGLTIANAQFLDKVIEAKAFIVAEGHA